MLKKSGTKKISVYYFASLREERGTGEELLKTTAKTPFWLYQQLSNKFHFSLPPSLVRVAVNNSFQSMNSPLKSGDKVSFIPPACGG